MAAMNSAPPVNAAMGPVPTRVAKHCICELGLADELEDVAPAEGAGGA